MKYPNITSEEQLWSIEVSKAQGQRICDAFARPHCERGWTMHLTVNPYNQFPVLYIYRTYHDRCVIVGSGEYETVNARLDALASAGCALHKYEVVP